MEQYFKFILMLLKIFFIFCTIVYKIIFNKNNQDFFYRKLNFFSTTTIPLTDFPNITTCISFNFSLLSIVEELNKVKKSDKNNTIFLSYINNDSNLTFPIIQMNNELSYLLNEQGSFKLIDIEQINLARKKFGLNDDDNLESIGKIVGLAKYLGTKYLLLISLKTDKDHLSIYYELVLTKSGEILYSNNKILC